MKKKTRNILFGLVILSLITIGVVVTGGILKNKPREVVKKEEDRNVLGEKTGVTPTVSPTPIFEAIQNTLENTLQNTKDAVSQGIVEAKNTIVASVEKEANKFTQSQLDSLKLQICKDWGVVNPSPKP